MKHILIIGTAVASVIIILLFPSQEWMNYLVVGLTGIVAYYLQIAHRNFFLNHENPKYTLLKSLTKKLGLGVILSILSMGLIIGIIAIMGGFSEGTSFLPYTQSSELIPPSGIPTDQNLLQTVLLYASSALAEETAFRLFGLGILLIPLTMLFNYLTKQRKKSDYEKKSSPQAVYHMGMILNLLIALMFGLIHKDSPGFSLISFLNISISGFIYGYLFLVQKDILAAWSMHFSWNMIQIFAGLPVSGKYLPAASLLGNTITGARENIISGGSYGPEGSIVTFLVQLCLLIVLLKYSDTFSKVPCPA